MNRLLISPKILKMKTHLFFTFIVSLFWFNTFGQITILATDMPQIGDVVARRADTMTLLGPGASGPNQNWVMTNLSSHIINETTTVLAPSSTPYASTFPGSNLAMTNDNLSYLFFNQNSNSLNTTGAKGDLLLTGNIITVNFNPAILVHNFPRNYTSNFSNNYGWDITTSGATVNQPAINSVRTKRVAVIKDTTDAWGNLTTPVGTYEVLRVKRVDFHTDSNWYRILPFGAYTFLNAKRDTSYSYTWLAKETKLAVAELGFDSLDHPKKFTWSLIPPTVVISTNDLDTENEFILFPDPASDNLNLMWKANSTAEIGEFTIRNSLGQIIKEGELNLSSPQLRLQISDLADGMYWISVSRTQTGKNFIKKFVISR
jgi:hypothetical protein